jgi:hypothetical protein
MFRHAGQPGTTRHQHPGVSAGDGSDLPDIQKTLAAHVTAEGVKAVRGAVRSANTDHEAVTEAVNSALKEMGKLEKMLSPEAK